MNENINLVEILEGCEGTKLWSPLFGEVILKQVVPSGYHHPIVVSTSSNCAEHTFTSTGTYLTSYEGAECILFPSKDQHDWSKFKKPSRFPKTFEEARSSLTEAELDTISENLDTLARLIVVRNAWWKADDNWKPDWSALSPKHCIVYYGGEIYTNSYDYGTKTLAFRTPELRDRFLKTHRKLINKCKNYI